MKKILGIGLLGLVVAIGTTTLALAQPTGESEGELDLDVMELSEQAGEGDTLVLEDDLGSEGGDFVLEDGDTDLGSDLAPEDSLEDTLVFEGTDDSIDLQTDGLQADEDVLEISDGQASDEMVLDGSGELQSEEDTLSMDAMEDAMPVEAEADVMVLDDGAADVSDDLGGDAIDSELADVMELPDEADGPASPATEDVMVLEDGGDELVLEDAGTEMSSEDADLMEGLDAEMAGMEDVPAGMDAEAGADTMMLGEMAVSAEDSGEMSGLDAEMAGMMEGMDDAGAAGMDPERGALVLDDEAVNGEAAAAAGTMVMAEDDQAIDDEEESSAFSVYAVLKNESAVFVRSGTVIGREKSTLGGGDHDAGKLYKSEFSLNVFANAQITPNALVHAQLNLSYDPKADPDWYKGPKFYTQYDPLRELYLDTTLPLIDDQGVLLRLGKQQVVWGTADGIKLLDIINPTDYRELVQNTFEDSRIPVWMLNLERNVGDNGNVQFIVAQNRRNRIPGLNQDGDAGQPFIANGVDSITGTVNGFLNIAPAMGKVADAFTRFSALSGSPVGLTPLSFVTVNDFATNSPVAQSIFGSACSSTFNPATPTSAACLKDITERPDEVVAPGVVVPGGDNQFITNLIDADTQGQWDTDNPNSAFEYMGNATFATFNTFASAKSTYRREDPSELNPNIGGRWKSTLGSNFNYSLNYFYAFDANPSVSMSWQNDAGEELSVKKVSAQQYVDAGILPGIPPGTGDLQTIILKDSAGRSYGPFDGDPTSPGFGGPGAGTPTLVFTEEQHRIHNIGASFDYALDTQKMGSFVLRGEFLYQRDVRTPLINRTELSIGNLTEGLVPDSVNFFKYVLGAETILFTNLTVSAQFIQFINLNFEDGSDVYHANQSALHLTNGLKKGYKYYNFGSLFLSKPFGTQQDGRVNNIIIAERGGGYWNRLDVEYRFTDALIGSAEWNMYFGERDTQFGQFRDSSNFQLGLKYIFE